MKTKTTPIWESDRPAFQILPAGQSEISNLKSQIPDCPNCARLETELHAARTQLAALHRTSPGSLRDPITAIINIVCAVLRITPSALAGPARHHELCFARHLAVYMLRRHLRLTYSQIGRHFKRDHATAINGARYFADDPDGKHLRPLEREQLRTTDRHIIDAGLSLLPPPTPTP